MIVPSRFASAKGIVVSIGEGAAQGGIEQVLIRGIDHKTLVYITDQEDRGEEVARLHLTTTDIDTSLANDILSVIGETSVLFRPCFGNHYQQVGQFAMIRWNHLAIACSIPFVAIAVSQQRVAAQALPAPEATQVAGVEDAPQPDPQTQPATRSPTEQQQPQPGLGRGRGGGGQGRGLGPGRGMGQGRGLGRGAAAGRGPQNQAAHAGDDRHDDDRDVFHFLLQNHEKIHRTVKELPDGVETLTESDSPEVAAKIQEHVIWMEHRVENTLPIRMRDPLFAEIFQHTDKISMFHEETDKGVRVMETSDDPYVVKLIQAHAKVVSGFVARGFTEAMKNHAVPNDAIPDDAAQSNFETTYPVIAKVGGVVSLPTAAHQPRSGTKIVIDVTAGGDAAALNKAVEKVAKYVNIYAGAGAQSAEAHMSVVFHGDATLVVLNDDAYGDEFKTQGNPNLDLLHQLHEAGVELYVCGQSLISKGRKPDEVAVFIDTAASALTAVVNLQTDGYAYVPLGK